MLPKIALVGRPNVGKSTLFNRLIRKNRAITHDRPGITRDRMEGLVQSIGHPSFILIDTGGVTLDNHYSTINTIDELHGFEKDIFQQVQLAIEESQAICLIVNAREGLSPFDEHLALFLRKTGKPILLAVNKVDGIEKEDQIVAEFHILGLPMIAVSAEHGHNIRQLENELSLLLPNNENINDQSTTQPALKLAIIGRPNAGKSSIINAIIGKNKLIVSNIAGTTRDSIDIPFIFNKTQYLFVDTAGIRRRTKITDPVERFSVNASIKSATKANITLYVIDATEGITAQDKRLLDLLDTRKIPFILLINKTDLISKKQKALLSKSFKETLQFCPHIPILMVSAVTSSGLDQIIAMAEQVYLECSTRINTGVLNRAMEEVITRHQPPVVRRVRPKFFYLTQAETSPPTFVFFVNDAEKISETYVRYLERSLRKIFNLHHAPMRIRLRSSHKKRNQ